MESTVKRKTPPKPDSRSAKVRATWRQHIDAQLASGLNQAEYCRAHGLQPKYFSLWKRRLDVAAPTAEAASAAGAPAPVVLPLIPVTIKPEPVAVAVAVAVAPKPERGRPARALVKSQDEQEVLSIKARLPNGVLLDVLLPSRWLLPGLLSDLAHLSC